MASPCSSSTTTTTSPPPPPSDDHQQQQQSVTKKEREKEYVHKTKIIQFLGRTTPIVLQNDNGPCPLLAICNVLLLRNNLNLSPDIAEVSQEKLLSLVAERLIDSNSSANNKDAGYLENQQQNIADAIDLLPRLATGIDVNIKFRRIDDFEFTRECAIFDLLDIPLYHGWIVDPQDCDTAKAIGSKSYNSLMGELVALETRSMVVESKNNQNEDCVDFAAATTATLGVPSPSLSKTRSFDGSPRSTSGHQNVRKGDLEEEAELLKVLSLSQASMLPSVGDSLEADHNGGVISLDESTHVKVVILVDTPGHADDGNRNETIDTKYTPSTGESKCKDQPNREQSGEHVVHPVMTNAGSLETFVEVEGLLTSSSEKLKNESSTTLDKPEDVSNRHETEELSDLSSSKMQNTDAPETYTASIEGNEPIYEGEERILESGATGLEDREPMYEGEVILAEQADKSMESKDEISRQQGELIKNFLKNNASQLTFYGLFCLQDGLKERELCVFFRNNHFSIMFKYEGQLYLLATDQGYINQPDLVWEKLNEVNGDTLFMTSNFKEFRVDSHTNDAWNEQSAMTSTADYLASMDSVAQAGLEFNSDLQLAIALQQQEFEQQQSQRSNVQQPLVNSSSRMIVGPQPVRSSGRPTPTRPPPSEPKSKDKCTVM